MSNVVGHGGNKLVVLAHLGVAQEELVEGRHRDVEPELVDNGDLHLADLVNAVGIVRDVAHVRQLGIGHLLVLGGQEQGRNADQLELGSGDENLLEVSVHDIHAEVKRLVSEPELLHHGREPVHQDLPHLDVDLRLRSHVVRGHAVLLLLLQPVVEDVRRVLRDSLWVGGVLLVNRILCKKAAAEVEGLRNGAASSDVRGEGLLDGGTKRAAVAHIAENGALLDGPSPVRVDTVVERYLVLIVTQNVGHVQI